MAVGTILIALAGVLVIHNYQEGVDAGEASTEMTEAFCRAQATEGESIPVSGKACMGMLELPSLGLTLPVLRDWSYPNLKLAPCLYDGSLQNHNLVVMAHNYPSHFGRLTELQPGDPVYFQDVQKNRTAFEVAGLETLKPDQVEEMKEGQYPLTLFTCTYGGRTRVVVRCEQDYHTRETR